MHMWFHAQLPQKILNGIYSKEETIQGRKLYEEIGKYLHA